MTTFPTELFFCVSSDHDVAKVTSVADARSPDGILILQYYSRALIPNFPSHPE